MTKEQAYRELCMKYGVLTLCYLLQEYAEDEQYEECIIILKVINGLADKFNIPLPTQYDEHAKQWVKQELINMGSNSDGDDVVYNIPNYAERAKQELEKLIKN